MNDMSSIRGQAYVARALEVAAAGQHGIVLCGCPGAGKAMFASTLATLLPSLPPLHQLEPGDTPDVGVLFLRDMHTWKVRDLTHVWQTRPKASQIIMTFQPCPCGFYMHPVIDCTCPPQRIAHHQRSKAPFLAELDMHVEVYPPKPEELFDKHSRESSQVIRQRVEQAHKLRSKREPITTIEKALESLDMPAEKLLNAAIRQLHMTPKPIIQVLRVARTIADLSGKDQITASSLAEAIQYRSRFSRY